jgi:hypothetical protein
MRRDHDAVFHAAGPRVDAPFGGRGAHQHLARGGAGAAQFLPAIAHAGAAAGDLPAEHVVVELVAGRREFDLDARQAHAEFLGDQHGQRREYTLAHFGAVTKERDAVIGADTQPGIGLDGLEFAGRFLGGLAARQGDGDDEAAHEGAARHL